MRFIVLGGAGDMGNEAVRFLAAYPGVTEVMVADLNLKAAQTLAQEVGGPTRACPVNALDHQALVETIRGYDVAVGFIGPFIYFERRQAQAAIDAGVHYVSIADDFEAAREALALDEAARAAGVLVLTGLGNCPGMTNLLAKKGAQAMDQPRRIHISWFGGADDASGQAPAIGQGDGDGAGPAHHVLVGQDAAAGVEDEARPLTRLGATTTGFHLHHRRPHTLGGAAHRRRVGVQGASLFLRLPVHDFGPTFCIVFSFSRSSRSCGESSAGSSTFTRTKRSP